MIYEVRDELISMLISIAPDYQQLLNPSSTEEAIRNLEEALEVALPRDYREFLKSHNGCHRERLLIAFSLFGVDEIVSKTKRLREDLKESSRNFADGGWDSQKLSIGDSHVGWTLAIDCSSGTPFVYAQSNYALPLAGSFLEYLVGLKDNLRDGRYQVVRGNVFMVEWGQRF